MRKSILRYIVFLLFLTVFGFWITNSADLEEDANGKFTVIPQLAEPVEQLQKTNQTTDQIAILVFVCNRRRAIREHLEKLLEYRPDEKTFPIIVSQDCDHEGVRQEVAKFGERVEYVKHTAAPRRKGKWAQYYSIARHYKLGLSYAFRRYSTVVVTEDDLDVAPDFFSFFAGARFLLDIDAKLWCVSAWNDNGTPENIDRRAAAKLYRSDFFGGLGWMITRETWQELSPKWPDAFWDDFMRRSDVRKGRQCVRPEISRTAMTYHGKKGASRGQFFKTHLSRIVLNTEPVDFSSLDLTYLLEEPFDKKWHREVWEEAVEVDIQKALPSPTNGRDAVRIVYDSCHDFIRKANRLSLMNDFKDGVPRTAYRGVVACFRDGVRVFLAPNPRTISEYVPGCEVK